MDKFLPLEGCLLPLWDPSVAVNETRALSRCSPGILGEDSKHPPVMFQRAMHVKEKINPGDGVERVMEGDGCADTGQEVRATTLSQ